MSAANIDMYFRLEFFMDVKNMNPDQSTPWEQTDLGSYYLQYRLP